MIQNPEFQFFQYNPYTCKLTDESYDHKLMMNLRFKAVQAASQMRRACIILGTLGRQGSQHILDRLAVLLKSKGVEYVVLLVSEINFEFLRPMHQIDAFIQIACPRISIDWSNAFEKPILTPYEAYVALGE